MVGFDPESFWDQTIRTVCAALHGKHRAAIRDQNARAWMVWHIAALQRAKKLPKLKTMMVKEKPRVQSWQEQQMIMQSWATAHNARLKERE